MYKYDTYRTQTAQYIKTKNIDTNNRWSYQFGIFTGVTLGHIYEKFIEYNIPCEKILAFDSFEGLPEEFPGIQKHPVWQKNEFNAKYHFQENNINKIIQRIESELPDKKIPIDWFPGYFNDVLTDEWMQKVKPCPAFWVDIDVDLYISAKQVLDFMYKNGLIVPNTIISYDDWGGTEEYKGGESMAHKEMCDKYNADCKIIHRSDNGEHVQIVFIVNSIGGI